MMREPGAPGPSPVIGGGAAAQLDRLYAQIPSMHCRGLCWDSCGPIDMSELERARLAERGFHLPRQGPGDLRALRRQVADGRPIPSCPALSALGVCQVYDVRPTICRAYGAVEGLPCPHGCEPITRALSREHFHQLIAEVRHLSDRTDPHQ